MIRPRVIEFAELDSTNRYACGHLAQLAHGDVIQAHVQTAGRGRGQRAWISHLPGNLCLSLVLKPAREVRPDLPLVNLSQLLALSLYRVLDTLHTAATLKWPNDLQVRGRKIAGILAETVVQGREFLGLVLGIGVNLNLAPASLAAIDQPATSLHLELGRAVDVTSIRDALLAEFFQRYDAFLEQGFNLIRKEYLDRCAFLGSSVEVRRADGVVQGQALDVDGAGALVLRTPQGERVAIELGEMFLPASVARY